LWPCKGNQHGTRPYRRADCHVRRLQTARQAEQHDSRTDADLQHDQPQDDLRPALWRPHCPDQGRDRERVREQPVDPLDQGEWSRRDPYLAIAQREPVTRSRGAEIGAQGAE